MIASQQHRSLRRAIQSLLILIVLNLIGALSTGLNAQNITQLEYYLGADPGFGQGTSISVTNNNGEITEAFSLPLTGIDEGFQNLRIRAKDSDGNWGLSEELLVYISPFLNNISLTFCLSGGQLLRPLILLEFFCKMPISGSKFNFF